MEWLGEAAQPRCPEDGTVLAVSDGAYRCRCGHVEPLEQAEHPGDGIGLIEFPAARGALS